MPDHQADDRDRAPARAWCLPGREALGRGGLGGARAGDGTRRGDDNAAAQPSQTESGAAWGAPSCILSGAREGRDGGVGGGLSAPRRAHGRRPRGPAQRQAPSAPAPWHELRAHRPAPQGGRHDPRRHRGPLSGSTGRPPAAGWLSGFYLILPNTLKPKLFVGGGEVRELSLGGCLTDEIVRALPAMRD